MKGSQDLFVICVEKPIKTHTHWNSTRERFIPVKVKFNVNSVPRLMNLGLDWFVITLNTTNTWKVYDLGLISPYLWKLKYPENSIRKQGKGKLNAQCVKLNSSINQEIINCNKIFKSYISMTG